MATPRAASDPGPGRFTDSGIEIRPVYGPADLEGWDPEPAAGRAGPVPLHPGDHGRTCTGAACGPCASTPGSAPPSPPTSGSSSCSERARPGCRAPSTCRPRWGYDSDHPRAEGEVGKVGVAIDSLADMRLLLAGLPLDKVTTSMTINATAAILLLLYQLVAEENGVAPERAGRHHPERHPEGVRGPGDLHLPAPPVDAAGHRHLRLLRRAPAGLEHHLDLRLPHPGGGLDGGAGDRLHHRQRDRLRGGGAGRRARRRRVRAPAELLLERPQQPVRGGGQVPGRPADVGQDHDRAVRGQGRAVASCSASTPRPAGRPSPPSSRRTTSSGSPSRPWPPPSGAPRASTPTASTRPSGLPTQRAAKIALRTQQIVGYESGIADTVDPLAGSWFVESLTDEVEAGAWEYLERIDAMGGAVDAIEAQYMQQEIEQAAYAYAKAVDDGREDRRRRQPVRRRAGSSPPRCSPSTPRCSGPRWTG